GQRQPGRCADGPGVMLAPRAVADQAEAQPAPPCDARPASGGNTITTDSLVAGGPNGIRFKLPRRRPSPAPRASSSPALQRSERERVALLPVVGHDAERIDQALPA